MLTVAPHPLLELSAFETRWPRPLGELPSPDWLLALVDPDATEPFAPPGPGEVESVRALLRHGGFKPAGRSKPCSEYIRAAAREGRFPVINAAVDATNVAALVGGLPVSTIDPDRLAAPLSVAIAPPGTRYVFNASGQEIDLGGLLCVHDADGPCSNAVKDSQRAKTTPASTRTWTIVWGTAALPGRAAALAAWQADLHRRLGGEVEVVA